MLLQGTGWALPDPTLRPCYPDSAYRAVITTLEHGGTDREALQAFRDHQSPDPTITALRLARYVEKIRPKRRPLTLFDA